MDKREQIYKGSLKNWEFNPSSGFDFLFSSRNPRMLQTWNNNSLYVELLKTITGPGMPDSLNKHSFVLISYSTASSESYWYDFLAVCLSPAGTSWSDIQLPVSLASCFTTLSQFSKQT